MTAAPTSVAETSPKAFRFWLLISAACVVPAVLDALQMYMQGRLARATTVSWNDIIFSGTEWLFLGALTPITYYLARRFPLRRETAGRTFAVHAVGSLTLCVGWASAGMLLRLALGTTDEHRTLPRQFVSWILTSIPWSVFMYFAVLGCVYAFLYFSEAREREAQTARLAAQLAEARLGALRTQLNPHFLFNSLNAINVLVRDRNTEDASRMLELLSDVLRSALRADARHEIPLREELQFIEQYLAIEQVRFSDRLCVVWSIDETVRSASVPGFVLQPLVENALRHGIARRSEGGTVEIVARREGETLVLTVRDDGQGLAKVPPPFGVGLTNTRERLRTMYGNDASLSIVPSSQRGTIAIIRLPYHEGSVG
ncbi:MAG TPA: histidine kinase [Gemmatimonadaceae bacterium]|nr:histidine kinase [Gemmatimonadaceae bacterium]